MKQALVEGAVRLPQLNMHEQGNGRINLPRSQAILANYTPRASLIPPAIHLADCPYMWPHCKQPLYAHALPVVLNATVVNGMANTGYFEGPPVYEGLDEGGKMLHVTFQYSDVLWPWSGYLAVYLQVGGIVSCYVMAVAVAFQIAFADMGRMPGATITRQARA
jgi:membrane-bound transcription factor site-1 protease